MSQDPHDADGESFAAANHPSPLATIPARRSDRWQLLREVVVQWYPPSEAGDGVAQSELESAQSRLDHLIPAALREWYLLCGRRHDIWSRQDHLLPPGEIEIRGGYLVFLIENQNVVEWGVRIDELGLVDPPVYVSSVDTESSWLKENDSVSEFALQMFVYCLKWSNKCRWWANAYVGRDVLACLAANFPRLPLAEWHWPAPTRFYGYRDIIGEVEAELDDDHAWLYVVTRTTSAAKALKRVTGPLNIEWNSWSEDWPPGWVSAPQDLDA